MPAAPASTDLRWVGIAKEATPGTAVAPAAWLPCVTADWADDIDQLADEATRGSMTQTNDIVQGVGRSHVDMAGKFFPASSPWLFAALLGDVATTGAGAPFSHTMSDQNGISVQGQPKSYTLTFFAPEINSYRQCAGCKMSDLGLKFNADGLIDWTAKWLGFPSALAAGPYTPTYVDPQAMPGWRMAWSIAGSAVTIVEDAQIDFKRQSAKDSHTMQGSQSPYFIWVGDLAVTGKLVFVAENEAQLLNYLNHSQPILVADASYGAGAALVEAKFTMTKSSYKNTKKTWGEIYVKVETDFEAVANATDAGASGGLSPVKALFKNAIAASTYV